MVGLLSKWWVKKVGFLSKTGVKMVGFLSNVTYPDMNNPTTVQDIKKMIRLNKEYRRGIVKNLMYL